MDFIRTKYKNEPIIDYCSKRDINFKSFIISIRDIESNEKSKSLSSDEKIEMALREFYSSNKPRLHANMTLEMYCATHEYPYDLALSNIVYLKTRYPGLTQEELVKLTVYYYINPTYSLTYSGMPLITYCEKNNLPYSQIRKYVLKRFNENPDDFVENIVDEAIKKSNPVRSKFLYKGVPLSFFCYIEGYNFKRLHYQLIKRQKSDVDKGDISESVIDDLLQKEDTKKLNMVLKNKEGK
jgi:hypothetical protein